MGLFGPAKNSTRRQGGTTAKIKTGGAGNNGWYDPAVTAAAAARPASAVYRTGGAQAQAQMRPTSARPQPQQQQIDSPAAASSSLQPTRQFLPPPPQQSQQQPASSSPYPAGLRARDLPAYNTDHEESCICTVCSCGRHACPPTPRISHYDPSIVSESRGSYRGIFSPAKRAGAPTSFHSRDIPFEGESTSKADYKNHGIVPRRSGPPNSSYTDTGIGRNGAPFDDTTSNKSDYPAHPIFPRSSGGPREGNLSTQGIDDRDFSTEGRGQYVPHPIQPRGNGRPMDSPIQSLPFRGTSTNHADFPAYANARPSVPKFRSGGFQPSQDDRDFTTEGRTQFDRKFITPCPAIPVATVTKSKPGHVFVGETAPGTGLYRHK